ncbi:MAG: DUF1697 domain-containing protein [Candidatus Thorarchaeota archaeon]
MTLYIAFLRGINVGGRNLVKMAGICQSLKSAGFDNISSYRASGNILLEADENPNLVIEKIQEVLNKLVNKEIIVFLRTGPQIEEFIRIDPFAEPDLDTKSYVTFIPEDSSSRMDFPLVSPKSDLEIILVKEGVVFSQAYKHKDRFGIPNKFIETEFKIPATTRNWNTIKGVLEKINRDYI